VKDNCFSKNGEFSPHLVTLNSINQLGRSFRQGDSGTDVIILKYFRQKTLKKWRFWHKTKGNFAKIWTQNKGKFCKNLIITLVFEKNAIFCRKLSKIAEKFDDNIDPRLTTKIQQRYPVQFKLDAEAYIDSFCKYINYYLCRLATDIFSLNYITMAAK
jgi:hypothetical protein